MMNQIYGKTGALILSLTLLVSGQMLSLVPDDVRRAAGVQGHCSGAEWVANASVAVLPVQVVVLGARKLVSRCIGRGEVPAREQINSEFYLT